VTPSCASVKLPPMPVPLANFGFAGLVCPTPLVFSTALDISWVESEGTPANLAIAAGVIFEQLFEEEYRCRVTCTMLADELQKVLSHTVSLILSALILLKQ
jgi:hypothetical protein